MSELPARTAEPSSTESDRKESPRPSAFTPNRDDSLCKRSVAGGRAHNHELIVHALDAFDLLRDLSGLLRPLGRIHIALERHVSGDSVDVDAGRTNAAVAHERRLHLGGDSSVLGRALGAVKGVLRGRRGVGTSLLHFLTGLMHVD